MAPPLKTDMYDNALFGILQNVGDVQDFLQIYFGFLYRKTNFYRTKDGHAEKMALKKFKLFELPTMGSSSAVSSSVPAQQSLQGDQAMTAASTSSSEEVDEQMKFQSNPESYNGAVRDNYCWSQDFTDVEVRVNVPETVVRGKQVAVSIQTGSVRVSVRDGAEERVVMEGELTEKINAEDSMWNLEPGRCVVLSLSKCGEMWWKAVLKGEPEIDISKINCERPLAAPTAEELANVKPKFDTKPLTSEEMKVHEMLQMGWDAKDSPFKGQQFDPSLFNIQNTKKLD